jgi:glutaconate CoA-transferase subunit A
MLGTEWSRFELSRAAKRVVLIADAIVDPACIRQFPNLVRIPDIIVEAVVHWPFAAWPQGSPGVYDVDEPHMRLMNRMLATQDGTAEYVEQYVTGWRGLDDYLDVIGEETIERLEATTTGFLLDPYRRWVLSRAAVASLESVREAA